MPLLARSRSEFGFVSAFAQPSYFRSFNFDQMYDAAVGSWKVTSAANASSVDADDSKLASAVATKEQFRAQNAWLKYSKGVVFTPAASSDVDEIGQTVNHVMGVIESLGPKGLNLAAVSSRALHPEHMLAVLRSTFLLKNDVPGWSHALAELAIALREAGYDSEEVLVGLD